MEYNAYKNPYGEIWRRTIEHFGRYLVIDIGWGRKMLWFEVRLFGIGIDASRRNLDYKDKWFLNKVNHFEMWKRIYINDNKEVNNNEK